MNKFSALFFAGIFLWMSSTVVGNNKTVHQNKNLDLSDINADFTQKLDEALKYLEEVCGDDGIKKVVILRDGNSVFKGVKSETEQRVWSCTKSFTSTVLGLLIDEGKCSLDDKVCNYVPEMKANYPDVTFRHFATMTSGYRAVGDEPRGDYVHGPSLTPHLPSDKPLFKPGEEFRYWDSAMNMFAYALRRVNGAPIDKLFQEKIADPIGMNPEKWKWRKYDANGTEVCGGAGNNNWGMVISASEFAKFGQLMLKEGKWNNRQLLSKDWIKAATTSQVEKIDKNTFYGFNWWTSGTFPDAPAGTFAAFGFNNNKCIVIPEWNLVVVRLGLDGNIENEKWNEFIKILSDAF